MQISETGLYNSRLCNNDKIKLTDKWGCGQGIGAVKDVLSCNSLMKRGNVQYSEAKK